MVEIMVATITGLLQYNALMKGRTTPDTGCLVWHFLGGKIVCRYICGPFLSEQFEHVNTFVEHRVDFCLAQTE